MKEEFLVRQADLISKEQLEKKITVIGAGAVGSFVTLTLAKMGFSDITVYDADTIAPENMNCQFYPIEAIDNPKVTVLQKVVEQFTGVRIKAIDDWYDPDNYGFIRGDIVISAVDSMSVRKMIYKYSMANHLLDARMGAEYIQTYHVMMDSQTHRKTYEDSLYDDDDAVHERCTAKSTMYTVNLIAGLLGKMVKDIATETVRPVDSLDWNVGKNSAIWFTDGTKMTL